MTKEDLYLQEVETEQDLMAFIRFPWDIYRGDRYWVPPLIKDQRFKLSPTHPFRSHAEMNLLLAKEGERVVGRVAGIIDHHFVEFHQEKTGFFGFFESVEDPRVLEMLFPRVKDWLKGKGMEKMVGPMNPSTNEECGLLVDGFTSSPRLMMPYNPSYYPPLLEGVGLRKVMDLYTYWLDHASILPDRLLRMTEKLAQKEPRIEIRPIRLGRLSDELEIIRGIYNDAWSKNWGFVPLTEAEIQQLAKDLKSLVVPELVLFAHWDGEPVAFSVSLPDYNEVLIHLNGKLGLLGGLKFLYYSRKIHTVRVMLLGVKQAFQKKGLEALLYYETFKNGIRRGYYQAECSWILENNLLMQHGLEAMGAKRHKTYRIYETSLSKS